MRYAVLEYRDSIRCASCRGKCCKIYLKISEGGQMPDNIHYANDNILDNTQNFNYYFKNSIWFLEKERFGVEPLYDVIDAYSAWIDSYIYDDSSARKKEALRRLKVLNEKGIHIGYCAYWIEEGGCIIQWEKRPPNCKEHRCQEWINNEVIDNVE
jgi:hypothetical protein